MKIHRTTPEEARQLSNLLFLIYYMIENGALYKAEDALSDDFPNKHEPFFGNQRL